MCRIVQYSIHVHCSTPFCFGTAKMKLVNQLDVINDDIINIQLGYKDHQCTNKHW